MRFLLGMSLLLCSCVQKEKERPLHMQMFRWSSASANLRSAVNSCDRFLVNKYWRDDKVQVDKLLPIVKERMSCVSKVRVELTPEFFREKQNRGGFLNYVPPKNCETIREQYDESTVEIRDGKLVIITTEGKVIDLTSCGGYEFPEDASGLKPDSYFTEIFLKADKGTYECLDEYVDKLAEAFPLDLVVGSKNCNFENHPNFGPWK